VTVFGGNRSQVKSGKKRLTTAQARRHVPATTNSENNDTQEPPEPLPTRSAQYGRRKSTPTCTPNNPSPTHVTQASQPASQHLNAAPSSVVRFQSTTGWRTGGCLRKAHRWGDSPIACVDQCKTSETSKTNTTHQPSFHQPCPKNAKCLTYGSGGSRQQW
jgi:hypothetical protein